MKIILQIYTFNLNFIIVMLHIVWKEKQFDPLELCNKNNIMNILNLLAI